MNQTQRSLPWWKVSDPVFLLGSKELALWWEVVNRKNPLVMTNSSPWFVDGPFIEIDGLPMFTVLKNGGSFHGELLVITRGYLATWLIWESKCRVGTGSCCSFFPWSPAENGSGMTRGMTSTWNYSVIIRPGKPLELKQANDGALTGGKCQEMDVFCFFVFFSSHFLENSVNSMDVLGLFRWVDFQFNGGVWAVAAHDLVAMVIWGSTTIWKPTVDGKSCNGWLVAFPMIFLGFQPSFCPFWCRISQPSTVWLYIWVFPVVACNLLGD